MAIETRKNNKQYFYRSRRVDGRVVKTFIASGPKAMEAAQADRQQRQKLKAARAADLRELNEVNAALESLDEFACMYEGILRAALSASGFYLRRGEWRRSNAN